MREDMKGEHMIDLKNMRNKLFGNTNWDTWIVYNKPITWSSIISFYILIINPIWIA